MEKILKNGLTTGTCAACALKAALLLHNEGVLPQSVSAKNPQGEMLTMPVESGYKTKNGAVAVCVKNAGDDADITHGSSIVVEFVLKDSPETEFVAGEGVGTVTKPGLFASVGEPAINPGPRQMMESVLIELLPKGKGAKVIISVPGGDVLAESTLNPMLGIEGGISIIGTTGIVRPMSEEAFKVSLVPQFSILKESGITVPVLVPGKIGEQIALKCGIDRNALIQTSNFIGFMLDKAVGYDFEDIVIFGHIGKLIKLSGGIFHTHSHVADARQEIFAAYLGMLGADTDILQKVLSANTTETIMRIISECEMTGVYSILAQKAAQRSALHVKGKASVGIVMADIKGNVMGFDDNAKRIGERLQWKIN